MSQKDVEAVFGPPWVQRALAFERSRADGAEKALLAVRRMLRERIPALPHEVDGTSWAPIEKDYMR